MSMRYIDSHAHYFDERFVEAYGEGVDAMINTLFCEAGVSAIINVGTNDKNSAVAIQQACRFSSMYAAVGLHPTDAQLLSDIPRALSAIDGMLSHPRVVALGEIGLDYHYDDTMRALQSYVLHEQLRMAEKHHMPVIIHDRDAHGDCFDAICAHPRVKGVFHSYSGSLEMAKELIRRGWYISFSGTVTFKNASRVAAVAAALPHDRVLVETDAPYLAPHPHRGQLNHSGMIPYTISVLAALWGLTPEECACITADNTRRLFALQNG